MKKLMQLVGLTIVAVLFQGCAGYNTTMFTTKSNAGLDLDMKPPTAEINISRKEAVIEPAFENGKTPPVLASFKPRVGFSGSFKNYFVGVDQTFAGGDAAKTMAILYDSPTFTVGDDGIFDSTLMLTTPIKSPGSIFDPMVTPAEPGKIRPFFFGTDTQLGLKVAWSGAGGQFPDTVKLGFNRKEFAWAPITMSGNKLSVKMPSFLATIESNNGGGSDTNSTGVTNGINQAGSIEGIQYFATGEAASRLARQKGVRDAMLKRLDPTYAPSAGFHNSVVLRHMLLAMSQVFQQLDQDAVAVGFYAKLQDLHGIDLPNSFESSKPALFFYTFTSAGGAASATLKKGTTKPILGMPAASISIDLVDAYISTLEKSVASLESAKAQLAGGATVQFATDAGPMAAITPANILEIQAQLDLQKQQIQETMQQVSSNQDVSAAYDYFNHLTKQ